MIDFVIVPKGGNPLLAKSVSDKLNANLLVLKDEKEASSINVDISNYPKEYFIVNFEGGHTLLKKAEENSNRKLNGIVLDCNASTGFQVYNAIDTFNTMIENNIINANPIKVAYVLFRVNDEISVFDDKARNIKKYELIRFFDLDEKLKEILYGYSIKNIAIDYIVNENKIIIDEFINKNFKNKLLSNKNHK